MKTLLESLSVVAGIFGILVLGFVQLWLFSDYGFWAGMSVWIFIFLIGYLVDRHSKSKK